MHPLVLWSLDPLLCWTWCFLVGMEEVKVYMSNVNAVHVRHLNLSAQNVIHSLQHKRMWNKILRKNSPQTKHIKNWCTAVDLQHKCFKTNSSVTQGLTNVWCSPIWKSRFSLYQKNEEVKVYFFNIVLTIQGFSNGETHNILRLITVQYNFLHPWRILDWHLPVYLRAARRLAFVCGRNKGLS